LILRIFNHATRRGAIASGSSAYSFAGERSANFGVTTGSDVNQGEFPMTFVGRLSVVAAYLAFAFVAAIVLGVF
jgi:hypothetical protein